MKDVKEFVVDEAKEVPAAALQRLPLSLVLTNPRLGDNPIVFANEAFEALSGRRCRDVIGRNCRFMQGEETEPDRIAELRRAVAEERDATVELTNYRADGTPFRNRVSITPITGDSEEVRLFLGIQRDLDDCPETELLDQLAELQHRVKNHLAMIIGLIRLQAGKDSAAGDYDTLARRVEALQLLYQELSPGGIVSTSSAEVPLGAYVSRVAAAIGHLDGRQGVRINVAAEEIGVGAEVAGRVGLLLSEALTNAFQHAFAGREAGLVETRLQRLSNDIVRLQVADDGVGLPDGASWPEGESLGGRIALALLRGLRARHSVDSSATGTTVTIDIPLAGAPGAS